MSQIIQAKVDGVAVKGAYRKVSTEGDAYRFITAQEGFAQVIYIYDQTILPDSRRRATPGGTAPPFWVDFVLDFRYLVGVHQLEVFSMVNTTGQASKIPDKTVIEQGRLACANWPSGLHDPNGSSLCNFEELNPDTVRVYNIPSGHHVFLFTIPHTSLPGELWSRVQVRGQTDKVAIDLLGDGDGIRLRSEGGKVGLLRIDDELGLGIDPA